MGIKKLKKPKKINQMAKRKVILITSVDVMCNPPKDEVDKQKKVKTNLEIYQESIKKLSEVFDVIDPLKGCEKTVELLSNGPIISYGDCLLYTSRCV